MKLGNLLKKELKELFTLQAFAAMVFVCVLLIAMGQIIGGVMEEAINNTTVNIVNEDSSEFTAKMLEALPEYGADPKLITLESDDYCRELENLEIHNLVVIPQGFGESIENGSGGEVKCISLVDKTGVASSMSDISAASLTSAISEYASDYVKSELLNLDEKNTELMEQPVITTEYTASNGKTVNISSQALSAVLMTQSFIAPIAVFFLILMASQMIMTAISTEKIDKTLETLLSAPVSRVTVLAAKMLAALIVALVQAGFMIVGFVFYIQGMMGSAMETEINMTGDAMNITEAMTELGLTLSVSDILLFGVQIFLTIAIGLSASLILGAMATDVKSVQTLVMPIMMSAMIPFFVTMFADVNTLPIPARIFMYAIPFTHTYTAMGNMMFGNMTVFWAGLVYQLVFFVVCMYLAVKMFTTDRLFTMNFSGSFAVKKSGAGKKGGGKDIENS